MEYLEGRQSVLAALRARRRRIHSLLIRHGLHEESIRDILEQAGQGQVPVRRTDAAELDALSSGASHGGVVAAVGPLRRTGMDELFEVLDRAGEPPLLLLMEGADDTRNLGFVLRTALALGVHAVLVKKHLWDFDSAVLARASSGASELLPLVQLEDVQPLQQLRHRGIVLLGCLAGVRRTLYEADLRRGTILAIGGEKRGLSGAVRSICDAFVTIPSRDHAPSLSLSHAAAIAVAEAARQRGSAQAVAHAPTPDAAGEPLGDADHR